MSEKNLRAVSAGKRTNAVGKQVRNEGLLATPDSEFELICADLKYTDLPSHLSRHISKVADCGSPDQLANPTRDINLRKCRFDRSLSHL